MAVIGRVLDKLVPLIKEEVDLHLNADGKAKTLAENLKNIRELLYAVERKQIQEGDSSIKQWVQKVLDLAYEVEDALDDWEAANHHEEDEAKRTRPMTINSLEKVCLCLLYPCLVFNQVFEHRAVALDIKDLNERVKTIYDEGIIAKELKEKLILGNSTGTCNLEWKIRTTSYNTSSDVSGLEAGAKLAAACSHEHSMEEIPGQSPSYRDNLNLTFGCKHYKRNCKLFAPCCNKLYTCKRCHDELADHSIDRNTITKMMCMKCLEVQPIGHKCATSSCNGFSMGRYCCKICRLFDDDRQIYHCPFCNFHCMTCNACLSTSFAAHVCREKCLEDNCPICHEYMFTPVTPVRALVCGHMMHSACFQDYSRSHYICPICSKSLGDMQEYFGMLDALLAEEEVPEEYSGLMQEILCNDCGERGTAPFHWLYHKCPHCGSYNTRLL